MPDAFTPNRGLIQSVVGGDSGTWGTLLNSGLMTVLDNILGTSAPITINSVDVTLTTTQFQNAGIALSGTLTGNRNLILPLQNATAATAVGGQFYVVNATQGPFTITVKTAAANATSTTVLAPQGQVVNLYSDGINVGYTDSGTPSTVPAVSGSPNTQLAGTAGATNVNASLGADFTNGKLYLCTKSGTAGSAQWTDVAGAQGFDGARNLAFTATVSANVLTVTGLAANTGTTPAVGSPIVIPFSTVASNGTTITGNPTLVSVTGTFAISTIVGATLGAANNKPFRQWIVGMNNNGTAVLSLINCSSTSGVAPINEGALATSTAMSSGATSTGVFYTPSGTTISGNGAATRILGYLEYSSGLVTAGTYNNAPTATVLFGPGVKKPGDIVQSAFGSNASGAASVAIQPSSAVNPIKVGSAGFLVIANSAAILISGSVQLKRGSTLLQSVTYATQGGASGGNLDNPFAHIDLDSPATTASLTYSVAGVTVNIGGSNVIAEEVMG